MIKYGKSSFIKDTKGNLYYTKGVGLQRVKVKSFLGLFYSFKLK